MAVRTSWSKRARPPASKTWWCLAAGLTSTACIDTVTLGSECRSAPDACVAADLDGEFDASVFVPGPLDPAPDSGPGCVVSSRPDGGPSCLRLPAPAVRFRLDEAAGLVARDSEGVAPAGALTHFSESAWGQGRVDGALSFDGVDDYVEIGAIARPVRTISLWLMPASTHVVSSQTEVLRPSTHGPLDDWGSPEKAYQGDNQLAYTAGLLGIFKLQHWGGFQLDQQVPPGADIQGISVAVDTANLGLLGYFSVELSWDGGTSHTNAKYGWGQLVAGSPLRHAGGSDKPWGRSWNTSEFADSNFRVRASFGGIVNTMYIDSIALQVYYKPFAIGRTILGLGDTSSLSFADQSSGELAVHGAVAATTLVNGVAGAALTPGEWNHIALVSQAPLPLTQLRLAQPNARPGAPFAGAMDDVTLFEEALAPEQLAELVREEPNSP